MVYTSAGHSAVYKKMSMSMFVSGYLMVMAREKNEVKPYMIQQQQEWMDDAESYGWEPVRAYHAI